MTSVDFSSYKPTAHASNAAAPIDNFMDALQAVLNGGLDDANILAAALSPNRLKQGGAAVGQALIWNGSAWAPGNSAPLRKTAAKAVNTTVAPTDLLNAEITIGAGAMGATGLLRLTAFGDWVNTSGGTASWPRFQLVFGGTTIFDTGAVTNSNTGAVRSPWRFVFEILNTAAGAQVATVKGDVESLNGSATGAGVDFVTGQGRSELESAKYALYLGHNTAAVDTTASKALVLNVINGSASASYETKLTGALVEAI